MRTLHDSLALEELSLRARKLVPDARPRWGRFTAAKMVCHVSDAIRIALGELHGEPVRSPLRLAPLRFLVVYALPWPKGAPSFKEAFTSDPAGLDDDIAALEELMRRFAARAPASAWPEHPLLGRLSGQGWSRLMYRHVDHHLRQFGL